MAEASEKNGKRVMVAIEENDCSHYALEWTLLNLKPTLSSPLFLLSVQPFAYIAASSYDIAPPELVRSVQEYQNKAAQALLEKAKEICAKHGVDAETMKEVGDPKEVICQAAERLKVDLLVLGNHGRGAVESVSNYCVHNAKCPVLVVKQEGGKD